MPRVGFEPTISVGERPKTYALDRAATGTGKITTIKRINVLLQKLINPQLVKTCPAFYASRTFTAVP